VSLDVYLYGERIGTMFPAGRDDYRFAYSRDCVERFGWGTALLSTSLPTTEEPFSADATRAYVEGLLPDGTRRLKLARELGIEPGDGYALIAELGRDCAGAVVFLPEGERAAEPSASSIAPVREEELEELVCSPPPRFFDAERPQRMRAVLPGVRHKLSLARPRPGGSWAWPRADLPSTHIVKPETGEHPEMVANEMFCTTVVGETGLFVAATAVETIAGRPCLVAERFDRGGQGFQMKRFHQESFCQALGFAPDAEPESEEADGPGFAESCGLLRAIGQEERIANLLAAALCNYILGNGDAHGSNFALMVVPNGSLLAPLYDIVSSAVYDDPTHVGMVVADDYAENAYLLELAQICDDAGIDFEHCRRVAANVSVRMSRALDTVAERARREGWYAPVIDGILEFAAERALNLGYEVQY
jgi:serine/threonine-protein kinase HipA